MRNPEQELLGAKKFRTLGRQTGAMIGAKIAKLALRGGGGQPGVAPDVSYPAQSSEGEMTGTSGPSSPPLVHFCHAALFPNFPGTRSIN
jgi:hypothetical protein